MRSSRRTYTRVVDEFSREEGTMQKHENLTKGAHFRKVAN